MNLCKDCAFFHNQEPYSPRANVWYNHLCKASPRVEATNPQTGETQYKSKNDLGMNILTDDPFEFCRDINPDGDCSKFVPATFMEPA